MFAGLSGGVMMTSLFCTKSARPETPTLSLTSSMYVPLADANTSAVPSDSIEAARSPDDPKLNVTVVPGFAASKSEPICVNAAVREDAAKTVSSVASTDRRAHRTSRRNRMRRGEGAADGQYQETLRTHRDLHRLRWGRIEAQATNAQGKHGAATV